MRGIYLFLLVITLCYTSAASSNRMPHAACRSLDSILAIQSVDEIRSIAVQGEACAQWYMGLIHFQGRGVPQNDAEAVAWYKKAADQGRAVAQTSLGFMYREGRGVLQDYVKSVKWFKKASNQGNAYAQFYLGLMYAGGRGVPQDDAEAVKWYQKAADQGCAAAQYKMGSVYEEGKGVPQNDADAMKWYQKAADQRYAAARRKLGLMSSVRLDPGSSQNGSVIDLQQPTVAEAITSDYLIGQHAGGSDSSDTIIEDKTLISEIHHFVYQWAESWENTAGRHGDIGWYAACYADHFSSDGMTVEEWVSDKVAHGKQIEWIEISISSIEIKRVAAQKVILVILDLGYESSNYSETMEKFLVLKRHPSGWKIIEEGSMKKGLIRP